MANPAIVVDFVANTKDLNRGFNQAGGASSSFGTKLKSLAKTGALAAGAAGIAGLTAAVKIGISEYAEAAKVTAQTNAVIKSTGKAAGVSTKQVQDLAESLMKKSGVDDEAIQSGENLLLTFTNIRNEAGKGNDVFNQTTKAALDMSVALGTDMQSAAMQLGKALNDPIKGVTKLQRSGVTFTDAQKKQIQALQESGKTLEAQKIILGEVNKEFGGSAEAAGKTLPGQLNILKQTFNNFMGDLVAKAIPTLRLMISWLRDHWPEIQAVILNAWANIKPALIGFGQLVAEVVKVVADNWSLIGPLVMGVAKTMTIGLRIMGGALQVLAALLRGDFSGAWQAAKRTVEAVLGAIKSLVTAYFNIFKTVITAAWGVVRNATENAWDGVRAAVRGAIDAVKNLLRGLVDWIGDLGRGILASALSRVGNVFDRIADGARDAYQAVRGVLNDMVGFINGIIDRVGAAASRVANAIKGPINTVLGAIDAVKITIPSIKLPSIKIGPKRFGGGTIGGFTIDPFPNVPRLARGGIVSQPTLAMVGEGGGREIVAPESLLREIVGSRMPNVRVFIGNQELRGLVRTEIDDSDTGIARTLLAGRA
jgi:hypothetical protein